MTKHLKTWLAIPVFNHSAKLAGLVSKCLSDCPDIVVVDDGSTDQDIGKILSGMPVHLITHSRNMGKGEAIRSAARFISDKGGGYMITMDADGQHLPDVLPLFLDAIAARHGAVLIGARDFTSQKIPLASRTGRRISNFLVEMETGYRLSDTQSGFRAYPVALFSEVECSSSRFSFETEIIVRALWKGYKVEEFGMPVFYPKGKERITHFSLIMDNARIFLLHARLLLEKTCR